MKKLLTALLAFVMLFSLYAGALSLDTAEEAAEAAVEDTASVMGETLLDIETTHPEYGDLIYYNNFELAEYTIGASADQTTSSTYQTDKITADIKINDAWGSGSTRTFVADPFKNGKAIKVTPKADGTENYPNSFIAYGNMSGAGTYTFVVDYAADKGITGANFSFEISPRINKNNTRQYYSYPVNDENRGMWNTAVHQVVFENDKDFLDHFLVQSRLSSVTKPYDASKYCFYFDNVRIYYKKPDNSNVGSGVEGAVKTVTFDKALDADLTTVDVGYTDATYVINDKKCTITAVGYAGVITINAAFTDETTEKRVIKLYGGNKWKPGLNVFTGTTEGFTAEGEDLEAAKYAMVFNDGASLGVNPFDDDAVNSSENVIKFGGGVEYPSVASMITETIPKERGVLCAYDYTGSFNNFWFVQTPGAFYTDLGSKYQSYTEGWKHVSQFCVDTSKKWDITPIIQLKQKTDGSQTAYIDNLIVAPAYKFTYVDVDGTENIVYGIQESNGKISGTYTPNSTHFASGVTSYKLSEDGEVLSIDTPITLEHKDVVIYAAADAETPETADTQEMRFDTADGKLTASIRFKSIVTAAQRNKASEYGMLATRKTFLDTMADKAAAGEDVETELTFDLKYNDNALYVSGVAYALDENGEATVDKVTSTDENGDVTFAAVLTGIANDNAAQVNEILVARPYVKYVNGDKEFVFYGETAENSLVGVAKAVDTSVLPENEKANIEAIVALEKKAE